MRQVDHKHSQIGRIVNRDLVDIHKIFQPPELFGVAEIELDLEPEAVIVNQLIVSQFQVATEQDHIGAGLGFEIEFVDDDHIEWVRKEFVPHGHVIEVGLDAVQDGGFFKILVRNMGIVEFSSILFAGAPFLLGAGIREIEGGVSPQLGNQME